MLHTIWIYLIDSCCLLCSRHFGRWTDGSPIWIHKNPWWMRLSCLPWKFPVKHTTYRRLFLNHLYFSSIPEDCSFFSIGKQCVSFPVARNRIVEVLRRPLCEQAVGLPLTFVLADGNLTLDAKEWRGGNWKSPPPRVPRSGCLTYDKFAWGFTLKMEVGSQIFWDWVDPWKLLRFTGELGFLWRIQGSNESEKGDRNGVSWKCSVVAEMSWAGFCMFVLYDL